MLVSLDTIEVFFVVIGNVKIVREGDKQRSATTKLKWTKYFA